MRTSLKSLLPTQFKSWMTNKPAIAATTTIALAMTFAQPFTFDRYPFYIDAAYWFFNCFAAYFLTVVLIYGSREWFWLQTLRIRVRELVGATIFSVIYPALLFLQDQFLPIFEGDVPFWLYFAWVAPIVIGTQVCLLALQKDVEDQLEQANPKMPAFFERLNPTIGTDIIRLEIKDHYVEVVTKMGKQMIYMRFSDALSELDSVAGLQVHRSHWVAFSGIDEIERSGSKIKLHTKDGAIVPVSRSHRGELRSTGLLSEAYKTSLVDADR